jgi:hypothetical protein
VDNKIIDITGRNNPRELRRYFGKAEGVCYAGLSASFTTDLSDVIVVASNIHDLNAQLHCLYFPLRRENETENVAVFRFEDMRGKRLWK